VVDFAFKRRVALFVSTAILEELVDVLRRPKFGWPDGRVAEALETLPVTVLDTGPAYLEVLADEPDNRVLECAVAAKADYIVTGDRHLLELGSFRGCYIVTPRALLEVVRKTR